MWERNVESNIEIEIELLILAIHKKYGYDFQDYSKASFQRRIEHFLDKYKVPSIGELINLILNDQKIFKSLLNSISITVTEMFRDPQIYKTLREKVIPYLKTYPKVNIWHAGCATGQEIYSLAILLEEEGLKNYHIYATDINENSLEIAKNGIYSNKDIKKSTANYLKSGGKKEFSSYYNTKYSNSIFPKRFRDNITFFTHNLATDEIFNNFQLIFCRNVLIYFNKNLQNRVIDLFYKSLVNNGFLCLGTKESLLFSDHQNSFVTINKDHRIFKKSK